MSKRMSKFEEALKNARGGQLQDNAISRGGQIVCLDCFTANHLLDAEMLDEGLRLTCRRCGGELIKPDGRL